MRYNDYVETHWRRYRPNEEGLKCIMSTPIGDDTSSVYVLTVDEKILNQSIGKRDDDISKFLKGYFGNGEGYVGITDFYKYGLAIIFDDREESEKI